MIYMEPSALGWRPLLDSWMNDMPKPVNAMNRQIILQMFLRFCPILLWFIRKGGLKEMMPTSDSNLVRAVMNFFDCFSNEWRVEVPPPTDKENAENKEKEKEKEKDASIREVELRAQIEGIFFFSCIWALGGPLFNESREKFSEIFRALLEKNFPEELNEKYKIPVDMQVPPLQKPFIFPIPKAGSVFEYRFIKEGKGKWRLWSDDMTQSEAIPRDKPVNQIIVPTIETIRAYAILDLLVKNSKHLLITGPTGTGKSVYVNDFLLKRNNTNIYKPLLMNFSAQTTANQTQDIIMSKLDKRRKGIFGPPLGQKCVIFVDDISMPMKEVYGAQPPIELLRMWLDHGIWYERKENTAMKLLDIQFVCAMGPPSTGNTVTPRFSRHFNTLVINEFDETTLVTIFSKIVLWHLDTRGFSKEFDPSIDEVVGSTLIIYQEARKFLLPTPAKCHYLFNLRDFSRVVLGVLLSVPEGTETIDTMRRLWAHEIIRVYGDRLVDDRDRLWLFDMIYKTVKEKMGVDPEDLFARFREPKQKLTETDLRKLLFCDFTNPKAENKLYLEVEELESLRYTVEAYLVELNNMSKKPMNLVLFRFAIEHLSRICRIIKPPRSHALLIGVGGSGRQSLTRLAAHINDYETFQVELSRQYGMYEWHEDIKTIVKKVSASENQGAFMFTDIQIKEESFLEDVSNILNTGEVPNLFNLEEKNEILEKMRQIDRAKDKTLQTDGSPVALFNMFVNIVREQLHVVLSMSPIGNAFRNRVRKFPAIVNCCTIDWFQAWPQDALLAVATRFLGNVELSDHERPICIDMCMEFHTSTEKLSEEFLVRLNRHNYVTPTSYLEMIHTFKDLLQKKRSEIKNARTRYLTGIDQLDTASKQVDVLKANLEELQPSLKLAAETVTKQLAQVQKDQENANAKREQVMVDEAAAIEQATVANAIKEECDAKLAEAIPKLNEANAALQTLTPQDITIVKTMKSPPMGVKIVLEGICIMKDVKPERMPNPSGVGVIEDYWQASKKVLADMKFLDSLLNFDKDNIPTRVIQKIQERVLTNENFDIEKIKSASTACEGLCKWITAIVEYDKVIKVVAPKRAALAEAQANYNVRKLVTLFLMIFK
jgi:dynein heavy chain, axonemal